MYPYVHANYLDFLFLLLFGSLGTANKLDRSARSLDNYVLK